MLIFRNRRSPARLVRFSVGVRADCVCTNTHHTSDSFFYPAFCDFFGFSRTPQQQTHKGAASHSLTHVAAIRLLSRFCPSSSSSVAADDFVFLFFCFASADAAEKRTKRADEGAREERRDGRLFLISLAPSHSRTHACVLCFCPPLFSCYV